MKIYHAKKLWCALWLLLLSTVCFSETWVSKTRAHYLVDEATGTPLVTRPDGRPEVFFSRKDWPTLGGFFTGTKIDREEQSTGEKFPALVADERLKIQGKDQWVRVVECCHDYSWIKAQSLPGWTDYFRDVTRWLENFGFTPDGQPAKLDLTCHPLVWEPVYLYDPVTLTPRWAKIYAVARQQYDFQFKLCEEKEAYVYSAARIGISLDDETVLVQVTDASPVYGRTLRVDARTGEIVGPNPGGFNAVDVFELLRYKDEFLRQNPCPLLSDEDKAHYPSRQDQATKTEAGRCHLERIKRYEREVIRHFLGPPTPPLEPQLYSPRF